MKRSMTALGCTLFAGLTFSLTGCSSMPQRLTQVVPSSKKQLETRFHLARLHERQGHTAQARDAYQQLLTRNSDNSVANHRLGIVYAQLGDHKTSVKHLMKALESTPHNSEILTDLGYAAYLQNDLVAAQRALEQALVEDPQNQRAMNNLAMVLGHQGNFDESFAMFRRVVGEAEANANLAYIHTLRGEGAAATERYSRSLSLNGNLESSTQALLQLAQMKQKAPNNTQLARTAATVRQPMTSVTEESNPFEVAKSQVEQDGLLAEQEDFFASEESNPPLLAPVEHVATEELVNAKHQVANDRWVGRSHVPAKPDTPQPAPQQTKSKLTNEFVDPLISLTKFNQQTDELWIELNEPDEANAK